MTRLPDNLTAAALTAFALAAGAPAHAETADGAFDQAAASYAAGHPFRWVNALLPQASGDDLATPEGEAAGAAMNRLAASYARPQAQWVNALLPAASGHYVAEAESESADAQFIRHITYYTRDMLDRGGWVNVYAPDSTYAVPNLLLAVPVGEGLTTASA